MKKRLVLIVSNLLVALIFSFIGYFICNYTQSIKVNDVSFATISNEFSEENNIVKLNDSEAKEIIKRLSTKKDNKNTLEMVFPIRIRIYDSLGTEVYTFTTATGSNDKVVSEIRSGRKSYTTKGEFTSFFEQVLKKYDISIK